MLHELPLGAISFDLQLTLQQLRHLTMRCQSGPVVKGGNKENDYDGDEQSVTRDGVDDEVEGLHPRLDLRMVLT